MARCFRRRSGPESQKRKRPRPRRCAKPPQARLRPLMNTSLRRFGGCFSRARLIRDQAGRSAFGEPLIDVTRTYLGSRLGPMRGRDGNIHRGHPRQNELAMISHLGAMISVTVGTLMAKRFKGEKNFVGLACIGEGGMQTGSFHE